MQNPAAEHRTCTTPQYTQWHEKHNVQYKNKYITVPLLNKIERIRRIVTAITVVPKEAWVPFGFNCWQSPFIGKDFYHRQLLVFRIVKMKNHCSHTDYQPHKSCDSRLDTHSSVQTLIDFTRTLLIFRFVIASMRSMVFECPDNFLCFSLRSRTSPLWKHSLLF